MNNPLEDVIRNIAREEAQKAIQEHERQGIPLELSGEGWHGAWSNAAKLATSMQKEQRTHKRAVAARRMYKDGWSHREIAELLEVSTRSVERWTKKIRKEQH